MSYLTNEEARAQARMEKELAEDELLAVYLKGVHDERERCLAIVEAQPLHPTTHTGERQRWVKDQIAAKIKGGK